MDASILPLFSKEKGFLALPASLRNKAGSASGRHMHRYGIEDEPWFGAVRKALEQRGFRMRLQPRSLIMEKDGRLPRIVGTAREFLEFAERQGAPVDPDAYVGADAYGDGSSGAPFDKPGSAGHARVAHGSSVGVQAASSLPDAASAGTGAVEARLGELRREQERLADERRAALLAAEETRRLEARCAALEGELARLGAAATEAVQQRDLYRMSVASAEARLRALQAELDGPAEERGADKKFNQLRRYLARELHPDLAGEDAAERRLREAIFKRVWSKIEQLQ